MRGARATAAAKRRQRACRPWDGAPKLPMSWWPTLCTERKATRPRWSGDGETSAGPDAAAHRGRRPGHVRKGSPGTWEIPTPPPDGGTAERSASERSRGAGKSECLVLPEKRGNRPEGPRGGKGAPGHGTVGGKDGRDAELEHHLNQARTDSKAGAGVLAPQGARWVLNWERRGTLLERYLLPAARLAYPLCLLHAANP